MALIKCSECGRVISDKASACVHCGCPTEQSNATVTPTSYQAILADVPPEMKPRIIKQLRVSFKCGLVEAVQIIKSCPYCLAKDISKTEAECIKQIFSSIGADIQLQPSGADYSRVTPTPKPVIVDTIHCPRCHSTAVSTGQRGYSFFTGFLGSSTTVNRCGKCGYKWTP